MDLLKSINEMAAMHQPNVREEMQRIAEYWREHGNDMDEMQIREAIAMDLEQLEYSPQQVEEMVPQIMQMLGV